MSNIFDIFRTKRSLVRVHFMVTGDRSTPSVMKDESLASSCLDGAGCSRMDSGTLARILLTRAAGKDNSTVRGCLFPAAHQPHLSRNYACSAGVTAFKFIFKSDNN